MKIKKQVWIIAIIVLVAGFYLGGNTLSVFPVSQYDTEIIVSDNEGKYIFTPDSKPVNIVCPSFPRPGSLTDISCGGPVVIFIDEKVFYCSAGMKVEAFQKLCTITNTFPEFAQLCENPIMVADVALKVDYNYNYCQEFVKKFGSISNPLPSGPIAWEVLGYKKFSDGSDVIFYNVKTISIVPNLKCGDNICSPDLNENNLGCPQDCKQPSCFDGIQNGNEIGVDCGGACSGAGRCENTIECVPKFEYGSWGDCVNDLQSRSYRDANRCGIAPDEPLQRTCVKDNQLPEGKKSIFNKIGNFNVILIIFILVAIIILILRMKNGVFKKK